MRAASDRGLGGQSGQFHQRVRPGVLTPVAVAVAGAARLAGRAARLSVPAELRQRGPVF